MVQPSGERFRLRNGSRNKIIKKAKVTIKQGGNPVDVIETVDVVALGSVRDLPFEVSPAADEVQAELWFGDTLESQPVITAVACPGAAQGIHRITLTGYEGDQIVLEVWWMQDNEQFTAQEPPR